MTPPASDSNTPLPLCMIITRCYPPMGCCSSLWVSSIGASLSGLLLSLSLGFTPDPLTSGYLDQDPHTKLTHADLCDTLITRREHYSIMRGPTLIPGTHPGAHGWECEM